MQRREQGFLYIIGGGTIRHSAYQQRTFNPLSPYVRFSVDVWLSGTISICPQTTSASNAVGSGELDAETFRSQPPACSTPLLLSGSSVNNLQRIVPLCRLVEWIGVVCMIYTLCIHMIHQTIRKNVRSDASLGSTLQIHFYCVALLAA